jgi:hypothetical protein
MCRNDLKSGTLALVSENKDLKLSTLETIHRDMS